MSRVGPAAVELVDDCASCGLESGVVEIYDMLVPACRFGIPATARCKLCGEQHAAALDRAPAKPMHEVAANRCPACLGELAPSALDDRRCASCGATASVTQVAPPAHLGSELALIAALDAWAAREQWASREALIEATFCEPDVKIILDRIAKKEPLEIVADPFANMGMRTKGKEKKKDRGQGTSGEKPVEAAPPPAAAPPPRPAPVAPPNFSTTLPDFDPGVTAPDPRAAFTNAPTQPASAGAPNAPLPVPAAAPAFVDPPAPPRADAARPPISAPPRAVVYPLLSVVAADGEIHPAERDLVDRFLKSEGLEPLRDDEVKVHHPSSVAHLVPKDRREAVVQLMCETATVDGMPDESERRVIRAYATAWNVPDEKVEFWMWGYESMSTSLVRQLWMKLRRFVLSARWSDTQ